MNKNHSDEIALLLMTCTLGVSVEKKTRISQFLNEHPTNWERIYKLAARHRLIPFVYQILRDIPAVPDALLTRLRHDCRIMTTDNLLKLHQYKQVDALLTENSIDHLPLKGIRLIQGSYPDSSLRSCGDLDVLIRKEDVPAAVHLLQAHEYQLSQQHQLHWQQARQTILTDLYEVSLIKPFANNSHFDLDLHWQIVNFNKHYAVFDLAYVRSDTVFTTEREVVLLVSHHGVTNIWQQIYYINDLYFLLKEKPIDWSWLMHELQKFGLERVFLAGLYWCRKIWAIELPVGLHKLIESTEITSLANRYAKNWGAREPYEFSHLIARQGIYFLKAQTQFRNRINICWTFLSSRLFRYSLLNVANQLVYIPREAGILTILVRAFQALWRFRLGRK